MLRGVRAREISGRTWSRLSAFESTASARIKAAVSARGLSASMDFSTCAARSTGVPPAALRQRAIRSAATPSSAFPRCATVIGRVTAREHCPKIAPLGPGLSPRRVRCTASRRPAAASWRPAKPAQTPAVTSASRSRNSANGTTPGTVSRARCARAAPDRNATASRVSTGRVTI